MRIVVAPDGFGGTLTAPEAAEAIAAGWRRVRPGDDVRLVPLSDGGEGLLDVVAADRFERRTTEVAGPLGHPLQAPWFLDRDGTAIIESAAICGLHLLAAADRHPGRTTSYGVGQLLAAARAEGARRILLGLGGTASVDGGAGALTGLGFRLRVDDGSGLKIGGDELHRVAAAEPGWSPRPWDVDVVMLADVSTPLFDAAKVFGPQKGASSDQVADLARGLAVWAEVAERDLAAGEPLHRLPGSGAAGGLGFGLACGLGATFVPGADHVGELVGLADAIVGADLVITGEGRLDRTSAAGKVVGAVRDLAQRHRRQVAAVVGQASEGLEGLVAIAEAAPEGPGGDPAGEVRAAAESLAVRFG